MKRLIGLLALLPLLANAQRPTYEQKIKTSYTLGLPNETSSDYNPFRHMQVGLTAGTTGFGLEVGTYLCKPLKMRVGFSYMPKLSYVSSYAMSSVSDVKTDEEQEERIKRLCKRLGDFINSDRVDPYVDMDHRLNFWNAKVLFDVYPFHKKNWHFTAGVYVGPKKLGKAINLQSEAPTMMAVNIYNKIYDSMDFDDPDAIPYISFGDKFSFSPDPQTGMMIKNEFQKLGRVVVPMGIRNDDGTPHYLEPNEDGVMYATATSHIVKPYVGVGYDFSFGMLKRWNFGVDAGALILGKVPHVRDNMGVCLTHDVHGIGGEVGQLIRMVKKFPVYPNLELRLSYNIY